MLPILGNARLHQRELPYLGAARLTHRQLLRPKGGLAGWALIGTQFKRFIDPLRGHQRTVVARMTGLTTSLPSAGNPWRLRR